MRRIISLLLVCVVLSGVLCTGMVQTLVSADSLQDQIDSKQEKVNDLQKKIDSLEKEGKEVMAKLQLLDEQTEEIQEQIDLTEERIDELEDGIGDQEENISEANSDIDARTDQMAERIRAIYMSGNDSYINMLFESKDFASFLDTLDTLKMLIGRDKQMVQDFKEARVGYEEAKQALESDKEKIEKAKADLVAQRKKLDSNSAKLEKLKREYEKAEDAAQREMEREFEKMRELIRQKSQGEYVGGAFMWPVAGFGTISARFGQQGKYWKNGHTGIDICGYNKKGESIKGKPILACNSGTVIDINTTNTTTGYGNYVTISHGGGISTLYAHMMSKSATVKKGDTVAKGQVIGYVGTTGNSTGYHLHIEFIVDGTRVDPLKYISY